MQAQPTSTTTFYLEMCDRAAFRPKPAPAGFRTELLVPPRPELNRRFYRDVGAQWNWTDRVGWSDEAWRRYVHRDALRTGVGRFDGRSIGYFELETQHQGDVEICYFGLLPEFIGQGLGGVSLSAAVQLAWDAPETRRVWLHTCTHDHKHALANYQKRGFAVFKTEHDPGDEKGLSRIVTAC